MTRDLLTPLWTARQLPVLSATEWEMLLSQARAARLSARLALHIREMGWRAQVPEACWQHFASALRLAERLRREVLWETDHIARALSELATPVVLLKGAAYVAAGLPPGRARLFSDIDILVARDSLRDVELALLAAGWIPEKLTPYDDRYYRQWMHELPPLQHVQRHTFLDVHHTVTPPTSRFAVDGGLLLSCAQPLCGDPRLSVLAPADMVLHSAVHLLQDGDFSGGLRDLLDINDLLLHFGAVPDFWSRLLQRAHELGLATPLGHVLAQLQQLLSRTVPAPWAAEAAALLPTGRWSAASLMQVLLKPALKPQHSSCNSRWVQLCRWLLYVRSHWLRMPIRQIVPHLLRKLWSRARASH